MQNLEKMKKLFVISGSSGVGKNTVIEGFLKVNPQFEFSVSTTTRGKREGEAEGVNYFYVSREDFLKSIENGEFLEWAEFSGNLYGTKKAFVEEKLANDKNIILEIETNGAFQVKEKMPEAVLIFIEPPSFEDLEFRLRNRNTESEEAILKRLDEVKKEMVRSSRFDYKIVNDTVENAIAALEKIVAEES